MLGERQNTRAGHPRTRESDISQSLTRPVPRSLKSSAPPICKEQLRSLQCTQRLQNSYPEQLVWVQFEQGARSMANNPGPSRGTFLQLAFKVCHLGAGRGRGGGERGAGSRETETGQQLRLFTRIFTAAPRPCVYFSLI